MKTVRRPPYPKWNPGYFPCSSLTPPSAFLKPSFGGFGLNSLRAVIEEVSITDDSCFTKPQNGTFKQKITDAIHEVLNDGPLHRRVILESVTTRGVHVGGGVHTVGAYLSVDDRFENVGKGIWGLKAPVPSNNGHRDVQEEGV